MTPPMRSLLFSTLYPSAARPGHGIFVETRLRELLKNGNVEARVVAPVPWFPSTHPRFGERAQIARTPAREQRNGIAVLHPRYALLPKLGMSLAPWTLAAAGLRAARRLQAEGFRIDVVDAHYFYPDGVAAALLARALKKPLVITARGSDINLIAGHALPRRMMLWAARRAAACVGVSGALVDAMRALGMPKDRLHLFRNGVDLDRFQPLPQAAARARIGHSGAPLLASVGNLVPLKGHDLCIDAVAALRATQVDARLLIIGSGPERAALQRRIDHHGLADAVTLIGPVPNTELATWYSAADALMLASSREGWPNVLLEAMACGTPVVATRVGGVPEIVSGDSVGRLVGDRSAAGLTQALQSLIRSPCDRNAVRRHAEAFGWLQTSQRQVELFRDVCGWSAGHA